MCHEPMGQILSSNVELSNAMCIFFLSKWIQKSAGFIPIESHLRETLVNYFLMTCLI